MSIGFYKYIKIILKKVLAPQTGGIKHRPPQKKSLKSQISGSNPKTLVYQGFQNAKVWEMVQFY